jgi:membrane associated rhomboid family serine protease
MSTVYSEIKSFYKNNGIVVRILLINISIYVIWLLINIIGKLSKTDIAYHISLNLSASSDVYTFITHPWTAITYMYSHFDFMHLFFNMVMFYFSGQFFTTLLGNKKLISTYIIGGFFGLFLFILSYNIFPALTPLIGGQISGASAAVMAIFVALGAYAPNAPVRIFFFGPFKMMYVVLVFVLIDFARLSSSLDLANPSMGNAGGWISHIGGAIYGAWFGFNFRQGKDISKWFDRLMDKIVTIFKPKPKLKIYSKKPIPDDVYNDIKAEKQKKTDRILDKISKSGYESLSKDEKDFLFNASKDL